MWVRLMRVRFSHRSGNFGHTVGEVDGKRRCHLRAVSLRVFALKRDSLRDASSTIRQAIESPFKRKDRLHQRYRDRRRVWRSNLAEKPFDWRLAWNSGDTARTCLKRSQ